MKQRKQAGAERIQLPFFQTVLFFVSNFMPLVQEILPEENPPFIIGKRDFGRRSKRRRLPVYTEETHVKEEHR